MLRRAAIGCLVLALCGCGGADRVGGSSHEPQVLTLVSPIDDTWEAAALAEEVERRSGGRLRLRVVRSPHLRQTDFEAAVIRDVQAGRYDLGWTGARAWKGSLQALQAPLLVDSYALQARVARDGLAERMLGDLHQDGVVGLGILPGPLRRPVGLRDRLAGPGDFDGHPIGVQQSPVAVATLRALGADPVPLAVDADTRRIDGLELQVGAVFGRRLDSAGAHVTGNVALWPRPLVLFGNAGALGELSGDERAILRAAVTAAIPKFAALERANETDAAGNLCRKGSLSFDTATAADLRALRAAVGPVYRELERDPETRDALAAIAALKRDVAAPPSDLPACTPPEAPRSEARTPLDGTWRMDTGQSAARPEFWEENYGHWIFVFDAGRFAITQENGPACTWGYGTFTVDGDETTWRFADGGGEMPNGASNKPGEQVSFHFSLFRDTAALGPVKGAISPRNFDAKPWRKLGPPSRASLSRRCPPPAEALP